MLHIPLCYYLYGTRQSLASSRASWILGKLEIAYMAAAALLGSTELIF
jgi:hypothetical protein